MLRQLIRVTIDPNLPSIYRMQHVSGETMPIDWLSNERNMELRFIGKFNRFRVRGFTYSKCSVIFPRRRLPIIPVGGSRFIPNASNAFLHTFVACER